MKSFKVKKNMKSIKGLILILIFFSSTAHAKAPCFDFDLRPYKNQLQNAEGIDRLTLYPSVIFNPSYSRTTTYFLDHGVKNNPDAYNLVNCKQRGVYLNCIGEDDTALLGIFIDNKQAQLHLSFITLSDLDEPLKTLKPVKAKTLTISGQVFTCPDKSPEEDLY